MHRLPASACTLALVLATTVGALSAAAQAGDAAQTGDAPKSLWIRGAGATFPAPLYSKWGEIYHAQHPNVSIAYEAIGSGEGVTRFFAGSVDFGASDAALTDPEVAKVGRGVITVPATAGMVVLAYNLPGVTAPLKLPRDVYSGIFAGTLKRWDDPKIAAANPDVALPRRDIVIVARQDGSGTTAAFTSHLAAISPSWHEQGLSVGKLIEWPRSAMLAKGNEGVASRIRISEGAVGYVEYGFARRLGLPVASLQNKAGQFVAPGEPAGQRALAEAVAAPDDLRMQILDPAAADAYPIVTYSWLLLYRRYPEAQKSAEIRNFVGWGLGEGQKFAAGLGYLPLPEEVVNLGRQALANVGY